MNDKKANSITAMIIIAALIFSIFGPRGQWAYTAHDTVFGAMQSIERMMGY